MFHYRNLIFRLIKGYFLHINKRVIIVLDRIWKITP
jgi:hypothetical protein